MSAAQPMNLLPLVPPAVAQGDRSLFKVSVDRKQILPRQTNVLCQYHEDMSIPCGRLVQLT